MAEIPPLGNSCQSKLVFGAARGKDCVITPGVTADPVLLLGEHTRDDLVNKGMIVSIIVVIRCPRVVLAFSLLVLTRAFPAWRLQYAAYTQTLNGHLRHRKAAQQSWHGPHSFIRQLPRLRNLKSVSGTRAQQPLIIVLLELLLGAK